MFDKLKAMGAVAGLMKNQDRLREAFERVKRRAGEGRWTGEAGAGAVRATVDGSMRVQSIEVAPALAAGMAADDRTRALAGSLIAEAVNAAIASAKRALVDDLTREAAALGLPLPPELAGVLG